MSHWQQIGFIEEVKREFPRYFESTKVLEIGSLDINGSIRAFFSNADYVGIDVAEGPGVDVVCQGQEFRAEPGSFDVAISCEVMEHNPHWRETFMNMCALTRPGGLVVMTCATVGRPEHGTRRSEPLSSPLTVAFDWDYYENRVADDFRPLCGAQIFSESQFFVRPDCADLYFIGFRSGAALPRHAYASLVKLRVKYAMRATPALRAIDLTVSRLVARWGAPGKNDPS